MSRTDCDKDQQLVLDVTVRDKGPGLRLQLAGEGPSGHEARAGRPAPT